MHHNYVMCIVAMQLYFSQIQMAALSITGEATSAVTGSRYQGVVEVM